VSTISAGAAFIAAGSAFVATVSAVLQALPGSVSADALATENGYLTLAGLSRGAEV
jgi:hypothetical protein